MTITLWHIIGGAVAVAVVAAVIATIHTRRKDIRKVAYMMDAMEDGELNFRFQDKNRFNRTLNRIRTIFEKQRQQHEQDSWTKLIRVLTHEIRARHYLRLLQEPHQVRRNLPGVVRRGPPP